MEDLNKSEVKKRNDPFKIEDKVTYYLYYNMTRVT